MENVCYSVKETDFPFECDYYDYYQVHDEVLPIPGTYFLANRNSQYGYYEITQPGSQFRQLIASLNETNRKWYPCAINKLQYVSDCVFSNEIYLGNCSRGTAHGLCFYNGNEYNFCENFKRICSSDCGCVRYKSRFLCETEGSCKEPCTTCIAEFEAYPSPDISIEKRDSSIYITVHNSLKLAEKSDLELYCFSENSHITVNQIWRKLSLTKRFDSEFDSKVYSADFQNGGLYWCEYFTYPDMKIVKSRETVFQHETTHSFILNVTIDLNVNYSFIPYTAVVNTKQILSLALDDYDTDIFIVRLYPIYNDAFMNLTFRINSNQSNDMLVVFEEFQTSLSNYLKLLNSLQEAGSPITSFNLAPADRCLTITTPEGDLTFPTTRIGGIATSEPLILDENGLPIRRSCLGSYIDGAYWDDFEMVLNLGTPSAITNELNSLLTSNVTSGELNENLFHLLEGVTEIIPQDINLISQVLTRIAQSNDSSFDKDVFTSNINEVMRFPRQVLSTSQQALNATDGILYNYDLVLGSIANRKLPRSLGSSFPTIIESDLILAQIANLEDSEINGMAVYNVSGKFELRSLEYIESLTELDNKNLIFATFLPQSAITILKENYNSALTMHLVTALYLDAALFDPKNSDLESTYVASIFVPNFDSFVLNLTVPVYFNVSGLKPTCAYWKYGLNDQLVSIFGSWRYQNESLDLETHNVCLFNHMTHFTLLINAPSSESLFTFNRVASVASTIGTVIIMVTAAAFSKWREQASTIVLLNYTGTVFVQHALLLLFDIFSTEDGLFCKAIGILAHYIVLVQFAWMLVISYMQYLKLVVVFGKYPTNMIWKSCILSWCLPIIPVTITCLLGIDDYNCFARGYSFYLGLVLPIGIVIFINLITFIRIQKSLFCSGVKVPIRQNDYYKVSVCIILFFLMGFTWAFGLIANIFDSITFSYVFCALTTSHGVILCVYFILLQKHPRKLWLEKVLGCFVDNNDYKRSNFSSSKMS